MRRQVDPARACNFERELGHTAPRSNETSGSNFDRRGLALRRERTLERRRGIRTSIRIAVAKKQHGADGLRRELATRLASAERVKKPLPRARELLHPLPRTVRQQVERRSIVRRYLTCSERRSWAQI